MATQIKECIVHNRQYLSKFHGNINQLRRTNQFSVTTLHQLTKRCCSCHEQTGESLFDLDHLRQLCEQIQSPRLSNPVKPIHYVVLQFPSTFNDIQKIYKAGRFVGRRGQNLQRLEQKLNVSLHIVNRKSNKNFRQIIDQLKQQDKENHTDGLWVLITMKTNNDNIEKIKKSLEEEWEKIDVINKKKRSKRIQSSGKVMFPSADISGDTRWKPKKQKAKYKYKSKQKQFQEEQEEIEPQPFIRPISMPKQINKYQKIKRK